ncbi:MAG: DNA repair protein RecO [Gammaproteobacteria bacterium]
MTDKSRFALRDAFILHSRAYKESSLLIDLFTRDYGRVSVIAKGVKKRKRSLFGVLQPFTPILVSWVGKTELHTLTNVELNGVFKYLYGTNLLCGYYVNELILRFLHKEDPHEILYEAYSEIILSLKSASNIEANLRKFECILFQELGYGLNLTIEVETGQKVELHKSYYFEIEQGPVLEKLSESSIQISGETLLSLENGNLVNKTSLYESKKLMRYIINYYLAGKPLKTHQLKWKYNV